MRFGILLVLIIAVGAGIGWALPTMGSGASEEVAAQAAVQPGGGEDAEDAGPAIPGQETFSDTRRVNVPVHFAYAFTLSQFEKEFLNPSKVSPGFEAKVDHVRDRSITLSAKHAEGGKGQLKLTFAPDGTGTRITAHVKGTGKFAEAMRKMENDPREKAIELDRAWAHFDRAAAEVARRHPDWSLNRAGDELLSRLDQMRYERQASAQHEAEEAVAEASNAAAYR